MYTAMHAFYMQDMHAFYMQGMHAYYMQGMHACIICLCAFLLIYSIDSTL